MNYIIGNIVNVLHDDYDTFTSIIEVNYNKGFILARDLKNGKKYKITIEEQKNN